ncbi:MAG: helix-turn-helix transcriptional regulator [Ignavibacteriae bacterium]|nr:helix-turn-helix transcriptional regulator [Ignavibacteriota bacterium]
MGARETVSKKLKIFAKKKYKSVAELARRMEMKPQALQNYVDGTSLPGSNILIKLKTLGCDIDWLLSEDDCFEYIPISEAERIHIPEEPQFKIAAIIPAGNAEINELDSTSDYEPISYDPENHVFLKIDAENGDSMKPLLKPGDLVLIDLLIPPITGDIVAARWDESGGAVKILGSSDDPNKVVLYSYNHSTMPIYKERNSILLYKVVLIKKVK